MNEQERRERNRERMREYHQRNKEAISARHRAYYAEHREEILAQQRAKRRAEAGVKPRERKPVEARKPEQPLAEPKQSKDEAHYRLIQAMVTARQKHKDDPRCPICGARQCNRALVRVCATCGSRIG